MPTLFVLGGLPGAGKTTLARALARQTGAVHLRIDTIEQALRDAGWTAPMDDTGYRVARALARDALLLGQSVIADSVNPIALTREAWRELGASTGARLVEAHVCCSDRRQHRQRVEGRVSDLPGLVLPTWAQVEARRFEPWAGALCVDTAALSPEAAAAWLGAQR